MGKQVINVGVRIVERPKPVKAEAGEPYRPAKKQLFKAIATCEIDGKRYSRTASTETEDSSRQEAFNKMATLVAKQGAFPVKGFGFEE